MENQREYFDIYRGFVIEFDGEFYYIGNDDEPFDTADAAREKIDIYLDLDN